MDLVVQFREAGGEVWKYRTAFSSFDGQSFWIPLDEGALEFDYWSSGDLPRKNQRVDLDAIDYYGFFLGNGWGSGTLYVDEIRLVR